MHTYPHPAVSDQSNPSPRHSQPDRPIGAACGSVAAVCEQLAGAETGLVVLMDGNGRLMRMNSRAQHRAGLALARVGHGTFWRLFPGSADRCNALQAIHTAESGDVSSTCVARLSHDAETRWWVKPMRERTGGRLCLLAVGLDAVPDRTDAAPRGGPISLTDPGNLRAGAGAWDYDRRLDRLCLSPQALAATGQTPQDATCWLEHYLALVHRDDVAGLVLDLAHQLLGCAPAMHNEHRLASVGGVSVIRCSGATTAQPGALPRRVFGTMRRRGDG